MKDKEQALQFLDEKLRLMRPYMESQTADAFHQIHSHLRTNLQKIPFAALRSGDAELDGIIDRLLLPDQEALLRKELIKRFGFSSLGRTPDRILKSVLSKGRISNVREAEVVKDRLADQIRPGFGSDEYLTFSKMMAEYETRQK